MECQGSVDEYYGTDGGLAPLCEFHLHKARHVVWDEDSDTPISKSYYDEVYDPILNFRNEEWNKLFNEVTIDKSNKSEFWKEWLKTEEGKILFQEMLNRGSSHFHILLGNWRAKRQPPIEE